MSHHESLLEGCRDVPGTGGVIVAVSGGLDSAALAWLLVEARLDVPVHLVSIRHGFRSAEEEARDLETLDALGRRLDRRVHRIALAPPHRFIPGNAVPEGHAREARYAALLQRARELGASVIATAHHADDQRETRMLQLLRGGTLRALRGMVRVRPLEERMLWRPLLEFPRCTLQELVQTMALPFAEDSTNQDLRNRRNRIRHLFGELAVSDPLLNRLHPLGDLAQRALHRIEAHMDRVLDRAQRPTLLPDSILLWGPDLEVVNSQSLRHYLLEHLLRRFDAPLPNRGRSRALRLLSADRPPTETITLGGVEFGVCKRWVFVRGASAERSSPLALHPGCALQFSGSASSWAVERRLERASTMHGPARSHSADRWLRPARPGDRVKLRAGGRRRVVDLLREHGVLPFERSHWPVVVSSDAPTTHPNEKVFLFSEAGELVDFVPGIQPDPRAEICVSGLEFLVQRKAMS